MAASQAMLITGQDRRSQLTSCLAGAHHFLISHADAMVIIEHQINNIKTHWNEVCHLAQLSPIEKNLFWGRQFLNPYAFLDFPDK